MGLLSLALVACDANSAGASAPAGTTAAGPLAVGSPAPDVTMKLHDGREVALRDLRGSTVLVYFYPKDDTPG